MLSEQEQEDEQPDQNQQRQQHQPHPAQVDQVEEEDLPPGYSADLPNSILNPYGNPIGISDSNSNPNSNSTNHPHSHSPPPPGLLPSPSSNALYSTAATRQPPPRLFFDIAPLPDATSFQAGYLGLEPLGFKAWIKGEVMLKLDGNGKNGNSNQTRETTDQLQPARLDSFWNKCSITLTAIESVTRAGEARTIELFRSTSILWESPSSTSTSNSTNATPPSTMPFSFQLTRDLPHCIHLPNSRLEYRLEAKLHSSTGRENQDESTSTICHLTRYSKPGPIFSLLDEGLSLGDSASNDFRESETSGTGASGSSAASSSILPSLSQPSSSNSIPKGFSLSPHVWSVSTPTPIHLQLGKTIYRRAEPLDLIVRIPPPEPRALAEKGLRLRCVEAELVRIIEVRDGIGSSRSNRPSRSSARDGKETNWLNEKSSKGKQILPSGGEDADMEEIRKAIDRIDSTYPSRPISTHSFSYDSAVPDYEHGEGPSNSSHNDELPPHSLLNAAESSSSSSTIPNPDPTSLSSNRSDHFLSHEALLSHSGKLCRFNSQRAILLRLTLHPPFAKANMPHPHPDHDTSSVAGPVYARAGGGGCESISQETLMHKVSFKVKVRIGMTGERGETRDVRMERDIWILPGAAGAVEDFQQADDQEQQGVLGSTSARDEVLRGEGSKAADSTLDEAPQTSSSRRDEKRQALESQSASCSADGLFSSTSNGAGSLNGTDPPQGWQNGEEYDGFIDIGRTLDAEEDEGSSEGEWDGAYTYEEAQRDQAREYSSPSGEANHSSNSSSFGGIEHLPYASFGQTIPLPTSSRSRPLPPGIQEFQTSTQSENRAYDARGPPPSMSESQNDWQVGVDLEVQVEGVGSAMPRRRGGFAIDSSSSNQPPTIRNHDGLDDPPPNLWANAEEDEATREIIRNHEDDHFNPPPPISPSGFEFDDHPHSLQTGSTIISDEEINQTHHHLHHRQDEDLPPPHSPPRPAYSLDDQTSTQRDAIELEDSSPNASHILEPPPYIDPSSLQTRTSTSVPNPPPRRGDTSSNTSVIASSSTNHNQGGHMAQASSHLNSNVLSPRSILGINQGTSRSEESRPPAYAHPQESSTDPQVILERNEQVVTVGGHSGGPPGYEA